MLFNLKLTTSISEEIKTALVKITKYFSFSKKVTTYFEASSINIDKVDKAETVKITRKDVEKSFELYEQKLVELSQKLSSQTSISNDDYNPQTEYYYVEALGKEIPITEL